MRRELGEPTALYRRDDGTLATVDTDSLVTCSWFAMCDRPAIDVVAHPILGGVPVCERCQART